MNTTKRLTTLALGLTLGLTAAAGCEDEKRDGAEAQIAPTTSGGMVAGTAVFKEVGSEVEVTIDLAVAPPGEHGIHIHENGACGATPGADGGAEVPGGAAGNHWNPQMMNHGVIGAAPHHLGDMGNITVGMDGKGTKTLKTALWTLNGATNGVIGKSIILHANKDDLANAASAGARIGCGVIRAR